MQQERFFLSIEYILYRCIEFRRFRSYAHEQNDSRNQKRRDVVGAVLNRQKPNHELARIFNVPKRTVFDWLAWFRAEGWDGLNEKRRSGRTTRMRR